MSVKRSAVVWIAVACLTASVFPAVTQTPEGGWEQLFELAEPDDSGRLIGGGAVAQIVVSTADVCELTGLDQQTGQCIADITGRFPWTRAAIRRRLRHDRDGGRSMPLRKGPPP